LLPIASNSFFRRIPLHLPSQILLSSQVLQTSVDIIIDNGGGSAVSGFEFELSHSLSAVGQSISQFPLGGLDGLLSGLVQSRKTLDA
jgi:hypothetical protein